MPTPRGSRCPGSAGAVRLVTEVDEKNPAIPATERVIFRAAFSTRLLRGILRRWVPRPTPWQDTATGVRPWGYSRGLSDYTAARRSVTRRGAATDLDNGFLGLEVDGLVRRSVAEYTVGRRVVSGYLERST